MESNLKIVEKFLPEKCYSYSKTGAPRKMTDHSGIVQHYFSGLYTFPDDKYNLEKCWQLMRDMNYEPEDRIYGLYDGPRFSNSAHFMNGRDGEIWQLVPLKYRAFHAGKSQFNGRKNCNKFMVGIENIGSYNDEYTEAQYISNANLCSYLMLDHSGIAIDNNVGHEDVCVPRGRKKDPHGHGENATFDWNKLRTMIMEK